MTVSAATKTEPSVAAVASARKSLGAYKPLIVYPHGGTEVCEQSPERATRHTRHGEIKGNKFARGTTYPTREEAIAAAQAVIDARREEAEQRLAQFIAHDVNGNRANGIAHVRREIQTWGGTGE